MRAPRRGTASDNPCPTTQTIRSSRVDNQRQQSRFPGPLSDPPGSPAASCSGRPSPGGWNRSPGRRDLTASGPGHARGPAPSLAGAGCRSAHRRSSSAETAIRCASSTTSPGTDNGILKEFDCSARRRAVGVRSQPNALTLGGPPAARAGSARAPAAPLERNARNRWTCSKPTNRRPPRCLQTRRDDPRGQGRMQRPERCVAIRSWIRSRSAVDVCIG